MEAWRSSPWRRAMVGFCLAMACLSAVFATFYEWHAQRRAHEAALRAADVVYPPGPPVIHAPRPYVPAGNCRCRCIH